MKALRWSASLLPPGHERGGKHDDRCAARGAIRNRHEMLPSLPYATCPA
jgi:hypothetical protein